MQSAIKTYSKLFIYAFIGIGLLLLLSGAGLIGYNIYEDYRSGHAQEQILNQLDADHSGKSMEAYSSRFGTTQIDGNDYMGVLSIPSLGRRYPIQSTWSSQNMKMTPCRWSGSIESNDLILVGHAYQSQFASLHQLKVGEMIILADMRGHQFLYQIIEVETVNSNELQPVDTTDWNLQLYTYAPDGRSGVAVFCNRVIR